MQEKKPLYVRFYKFLCRNHITLTAWFPVVPLVVVSLFIIILFVLKGLVKLFLW